MDTRARAQRPPASAMLRSLRAGPPAVLLLGALLVVPACARRSPPAPAPAGAPAKQPVAPPPSPATMPTPTTLPATQDVTIPADGRATVLGLEIQVVDVTEKRELDGNGLMRVGLRVRAGGREGAVGLTSRERNASWGGYDLEYRGGWRHEVELTVTKTKP